MVLFVLRGVFIVLAASVAVLYVLQFQQQFQDYAEATGRGVGFAGYAAMLGGAVALAGAVIALDVVVRRKRLSAISGIFLGLIAGLLAAYALSFVVDLVGIYAPIPPDNQEAFYSLLEGVKVLIGLITCYVSISLVLQTKGDFRFVIPYVEFAREVRGNRPTLIDTSVLVDGRITDIVDTKALQGRLVVPRFVLEELQTLADSNDRLRRARGRRGLDVLQKLQHSHEVETLIDETETVGQGVDQKLLELAEQQQARLMTNDYNLNKVATLRDIPVINLNDLAKALRPVVLPGETLTVKVVKPGENPAQGVGYLEDGTMVVVEDGRDYLYREIDLTVTSTIQTSAGRMIFGRYVADHRPHAEPARSDVSGSGGATRGPRGEGGDEADLGGADHQNTPEAGDKAAPPAAEAVAAEPAGNEAATPPRRASPARSASGRNPRRAR